MLDSLIYIGRVTINNRSAVASIRGYDYQFLHIIIDILECDSDTNDCSL